MRRLARTMLTASAALCALALAGCGFTPLYATPGVSSGLSAIEVVAPQGRVAFLMRQDLDDALGRDKSAAPQWRLDLIVTPARDPRGLRLDDVAERYALTVTVDYTLTAIATGEKLHSGQVTTQVSYDAADAPYAGIAARQNTQEKVASDAARRIQVDLAAWLARKDRNAG
jgi:LPS-assembly lipoprotein